METDGRPEDLRRATRPDSGDQGERTRRTDGRPAARPRPGSPDATRAESRSFYFPSAHRRPEPPPRSARSPRMGWRGSSLRGKREGGRADVASHDSAASARAGSPRCDRISTRHDCPSAYSLRRRQSAVSRCGFVDAVDKGIGTSKRPRNNGLSFSNELLRCKAPRTPGSPRATRRPEGPKNRQRRRGAFSLPAVVILSGNHILRCQDRLSAKGPVALITPARRKSLATQARQHPRWLDCGDSTPPGHDVHPLIRSAGGNP